MEIKTSELFCILTPLSPKLDKREAARIFQEADSNKTKLIGLDLSFVQDCSIDFYEELSSFAKNSFIGLFNIPSEIFTIFNVMNLDKEVSLFVNEIDFKANKHRILNRKFCIV